MTGLVEFTLTNEKMVRRRGKVGGWEWVDQPWAHIGRKVNEVVKNSQPIYSYKCDRGRELTLMERTKTRGFRANGVSLCVMEAYMEMWAFWVFLILLLGQLKVKSLRRLPYLIYLFLIVSSPKILTTRLESHTEWRQYFLPCDKFI